MSKFAIDPGHGDVNGSLGGDGGAVYYLNEQNCALDVGTKVISKLQSLGHIAYNVRPSSASSVINSLQKRCDAAAGSDYLVSIHFNAAKGVGTEVYAMSDAGKSLANKVLTSIVNLGFANRGVKDGSGLYVIRHSNPVAILIEICFTDTKSDADLYNSLGSEKVATAIVQGLTGQIIGDSTLVTKVTDPTLKAQIAALQYNMNIDYNAKLIHTNGDIYQETIDNLKSIGNIIKKSHKSHVILWIQQKLEIWGYLKKGSYTNMIYDEPTFQAVTELQKKWERPTDGMFKIETWNIFLTNK